MGLVGTSSTSEKSHGSFLGDIWVNGYIIGSCFGGISTYPPNLSCIRTASTSVQYEYPSFFGFVYFGNSVIKRILLGGVFGDSIFGYPKAGGSSSFSGKGCFFKYLSFSIGYGNFSLSGFFSIGFGWIYGI